MMNVKETLKKLHKRLPTLSLDELFELLDCYVEHDSNTIDWLNFKKSPIWEPNKVWYSTDTTTWNTFDTSTNISLNNGDKIYIRGVLSEDNDEGSNYTQFKMSGKIAASGSCNAIWNYRDLDAPLKKY